MGKPASIQIDINGILYDVRWDGASLDMDYGGPKVTSDNPPNEGPPNWFNYFKGMDDDDGQNFFKGCGCMVGILGLIIWLVWRFLL